MNKVKKEKVVPYNLRLPKELKVELERQAREEKRSLNKQLVHILEQYATKGIVTA